jgi:hypothetical protein
MSFLWVDEVLVDDMALQLQKTKRWRDFNQLDTKIWLDVAGLPKAKTLECQATFVLTVMVGRNFANTHSDLNLCIHNLKQTRFTQRAKMSN